MLAKLTSKNQLTLPKAVTQSLGPVEYFDVQTRDGQIVLTPVRVQRSDAVRTKLAEMGITQDDVAGAVAWARSGSAAVPTVQESVAVYAVKPARKSAPRTRK
jgi:hypothetical protein